MSRLVTAALCALALSIVPAAAAQPVLVDTQSGYPEGGASHSTTSCDSELGVLKRVYPAQVAGVDQPTKVWVTEICSSFDGLRADGNAGYLRTTIAANDVLVEALGRKAYSADDVFAVRMMGDDTINLFLHRERQGRGIGLALCFCGGRGDERHLSRE
jgi:hypothetical protein